ncbi:unnamed protein product [Cyprideis torosa]|uniref:Uncharacterized protein n=1 Tax=Cyprideis torosa TaxID=163714 RepID=A0A7R8W620_9CRUS|nr:unnamed protein product [Cyprideis torosa]CAG0881297.1 unnamed protein product [Cyprideis torosa]
MMLKMQYSTGGLMGSAPGTPAIPVPRNLLFSATATTSLPDEKQFSVLSVKVANPRIFCSNGSILPSNRPFKRIGTICQPPNFSAKDVNLNLQFFHSLWILSQPTLSAVQAVIFKISQWHLIKTSSFRTLDDEIPQDPLNDPTDSLDGVSRNLNSTFRTRRIVMSSNPLCDASSTKAALVWSPATVGQQTGPEGSPPNDQENTKFNVPTSQHQPQGSLAHWMSVMAEHMSSPHPDVPHPYMWNGVDGKLNSNEHHGSNQLLKTSAADSSAYRRVVSSIHDTPSPPTSLSYTHPALVSHHLPHQPAPRASPTASSSSVSPPPPPPTGAVPSHPPVPVSSSTSSSNKTSTGGSSNNPSSNPSGGAGGRKYQCKMCPQNEMSKRGWDSDEIRRTLVTLRDSKKVRKRRRVEEDGGR